MKTERILTMAQAISEAIAQEMTRDSSVFVMGEDIGSYGGIFGATGGLLEKFGKERTKSITTWPRTLICLAAM